ncbi:MAG: type II toxin-antitoxin system PemK/MazF family toxin [Gammaproteobacteria bacterium]|nr:type II toxin-antitoxin system PemK/MazF family toxin [Gammaproteobacteria bacterium]
MAHYVPDRNHIVWLDFEPTRGREIGKYRPALVLSGKAYNKATGLLICCPISTSIRGAATEVAVDSLDKPSVVASNLITTLDWRQRHAKRITEAAPGVMEAILLRVIPLVGIDKLLPGQTRSGDQV